MPVRFLKILEHRRCTMCCHCQRQAIEKDVANGRSLRELAKKFGLTRSAIHRHNHHAPWRLPAITWPSFLTGKVRGIPDKTKPFRWRLGESGNPRGRPGGSLRLAMLREFVWRDCLDKMIW